MLDGVGPSTLQGVFCNDRRWLFLQSVWEKPIWEGVWPYMDPMDSVFTYSIHGMNVLGKYGPHGELFCFLIQKELVTAPGSETFSHVFDADIRSSRSARLPPCT